MSKLKDAREQINLIDAEMRELFAKRMKAVEAVVAYKSEHDLPIFDAKREEEVFERNVSQLDNKQLESYYRHFIKDLMQVSKDYQNDLLSKGSVAYQGVEGAYGNLAAQEYFPHASYVACSTFEDVLLKVQNKQAGYGVIPFENSSAGDVSEVIDLLLKHNCYIVDTLTLPINHCLLVNEGVAIQDIREITSHPQALMQCSKLINALDVKIYESLNTALAAKELKESKSLNHGVLASKQTAALYDLEICAENISNDSDNSTKFIIVSHELSMNQSRISLVFTLNQDNKSGMLVPLLSELATNDYNLLNLKSFPNKDEAWNYYFYLELDCNKKGVPIKTLLDKYTEDYKIIGSY